MPSPAPANPIDFAQFAAPADLAALDRLIATAMAEDLGPDGDDVTSRLMIPEGRRAQASMTTRQPGVFCGAFLLERVAAAYSEAIACTLHRRDGDTLAAGDTVATYIGPLRDILRMERVALNFACHLSGIATLTRAYVDACAGTAARIYDTRKTIPGLRSLAKFAVRCGGGASHRMGLYDAVLIKDNHISHLNSDTLAGEIKRLCSAVRAEHPAPSFVEIEVDSLTQLRHILPSGVDLVLLDNMTPRELREAVALRDEAAGHGTALQVAPQAASRVSPRVALEASGGVNLDTVADIAATGVDRIAVGALTHSAPALDLGLDIQPKAD